MCPSALFVHCLVPPPPLPSFPTRRSSDLFQPGTAPSSATQLRISWPPLPPSRSISAWVRRTSGSMSRSEEHTSELQSLTNLVCRLLLEKKNNHVAYN